MQKITYVIGILVLLVSTGIAIEDPLPADIAYWVAFALPDNPTPDIAPIHIDKIFGAGHTIPITLYPGDFILDGNTYVTILNLDGEVCLLKLVDF